MPNDCWLLGSVSTSQFTCQSFYFSSKKRFFRTTTLSRYQIASQFRLLKKKEEKNRYFKKIKFFEIVVLDFKSCGITNGCYCSHLRYIFVTCENNRVINGAHVPLEDLLILLRPHSSPIGIRI